MFGLRLAVLQSVVCIWLSCGESTLCTIRSSSLKILMLFRREARALEFQRLRCMLLPVRNPPTSLTLLPLLCYVRWCDGTHVELYSGGGRACAAGAGLYLPGNQEWLLPLGCVLFTLNCDVPLHCVAPLNDICSGNFLFLCLVPVFGLVVWCFPRKRQQRSEGPEDQISLRNMEVCDRTSCKRPVTKYHFFAFCICR